MTGYAENGGNVFGSPARSESGATFRVEGDQPDFEPTIRQTRFAVECVTVNPTKIGGVAAPSAYKAVNPKDASLKSIKDRALNEVPTRFGGALFQKGSRRFGAQQLRYWELANTKGLPFVFAVQTFHEDGALGFSGMGLATYLYGIQHLPDWDEAGNLIIRQVKATPHTKPNGVEIPSGYFNDPTNAGVSAVLWSNTGTIPKFARMALQGPYPDPEVAAFRVGSAGDPDPNAHAPRAFIYEVGDPEWPETWGEGCILFHNPHADYPLPNELVANVANGALDAEGRYVETIPAGLHPFTSMTFFAVGKGIEPTVEKANALYEMIASAHANSRETRAAGWWEGITGAGEISTYRSDSLATEGGGSQEPW